MKVEPWGGEEVIDISNVVFIVASFVADINTRILSMCVKLHNKLTIQRTQECL